MRKNKVETLKDAIKLTGIDKSTISAIADELISKIIGKFNLHEYGLDVKQVFTLWETDKITDLRRTKHIYDKLENKMLKPGYYFRNDDLKKEFDEFLKTRGLKPIKSFKNLGKFFKHRKNEEFYQEFRELIQEYHQLQRQGKLIEASHLRNILDEEWKKFGKRFEEEVDLSFV